MQTSLIGRTIAEDPHEGSTIVAVWAGGEHRSAHWLVEDRSGKCWEIAAAGWALEPERGTPIPNKHGRKIPIDFGGLK